MWPFRGVYVLRNVCMCVFVCACVAPEEGGVRPAEPDSVVGLCAPREPDLGQRHRLAGAGKTVCVCV